MKLYAEQHNDTLKHGIDDIEALFPEYKDVRTGAPELLTRDQGWVNEVLNKVHKSPICRIRTRNMDARGDDIRAHGYQKGKKKVPSGNMKLMNAPPIRRQSTSRVTPCTAMTSSTSPISMWSSIQYGMMRHESERGTGYGYHDR